ncbi:TIGR02147 family protein [bacterium]|jgi:uncharacterized protein (TIGR02147 family)|nr:TIGR02147 family protein [bacterium]
MRAGISRQGAPDFRRLLQNELVRRTKENPSYSLRAFARMLGIQSGFLSKILLGQRRVTPSTVRRLGGKLGLGLKDLEHYEQNCKLKPDKNVSQDFRQIAYDHFQVISDWYHFAILELASIDGFEPNSRWIAKTLGLSVAESQAAIERLVRIGYIGIEASGQWKVLEAHTTTLGSLESDETNAALQQMQKQILQMAIAAMENIPMEMRDQSAMTMAVDSSLLPMAKEKIKKFRRELCALLESGKKRDAVYQLSVSLYPVTKKD